MEVQVRIVLSHPSFVCTGPEAQKRIGRAISGAHPVPFRKKRSPPSWCVWIGMSKCSPVPPAEKEKPCSSRWKTMTPELCHYCTLRFLFVESRAVTVVQLQWLLVGHSDSGATVQHPLLSASYPGRLLESDLAHLSCPGIISPRYPPRWQSSPADVFIPVRIFGLFVLTLFRQEICLHTSSSDLRA